MRIKGLTAKYWHIFVILRFFDQKQNKKILSGNYANDMTTHGYCFNVYNIKRNAEKSNGIRCTIAKV